MPRGSCWPPLRQTGEDNWVVPASHGSAPSNRIWNITILCSRSSRFGSEPPSVEDDVNVWRYAIVSCMPEMTMTTVDYAGSPMVGKPWDGCSRNFYRPTAFLDAQQARSTFTIFWQWITVTSTDRLFMPNSQHSSNFWIIANSQRGKQTTISRQYSLTSLLFFSEG